MVKSIEKFARLFFFYCLITFHVLKNLTQKKVYLLSQVYHPAGGIGYKRNESSVGR